MKYNKKEFVDEIDALWGEAVKAALELNDADTELFKKRFDAELNQVVTSKERLIQFVKDIKAAADKNPKEK